MRVFIFLLIFCKLTTGLNILTVLHHSMKSHQAIGNSIVGTLLQAGHKVTSITNRKADDKDIKNYRAIHIPDIMKIMEVPNGSPFDFVDFPAVVGVFYFPFLGSKMVHTVMNSTDLHNFLAGDEKFDICIIELFMAEALLGIAEKVGCSVIQYTTFDAVLWSDNLVGNQSPSSYVPHPFLHYGDKMTFRQRLWNTFFNLLDYFNYNTLSRYIQKSLYNQYFPNAKRSFDEMYRNTSLIFINNHVSSSFVRPHMPTQIEIGGIHVKPAKALPSDLQSYLDGASDGVILFSMGSYIDGTDWKLEHREAFLKAFGKLKQKVIWRYSNETLPGNPGNIKIGSWFPQRDILAHPNVKLFITHGGLLGTTEAIVEGVPVLGIPVFGDQMMNMAKTVARGYGLQIFYHDISEVALTQALNELLNNPKFKENAEKISKRFNDRPLTPQQEVVYWTEYVARHHGASHLQAKSVNLTFLELNQLDVYVAIMALTFISIYIQFRVLKLILKKIFKKSRNDKKKVQ